jgi:hypothetical protein
LYKKVFRSKLPRYVLYHIPNYLSKNKNKWEKYKK